MRVPEYPQDTVQGADFVKDSAAKGYPASSHLARGSIVNR
jgi:hypothetical protein